MVENRIGSILYNRWFVGSALIFTIAIFSIIWTPYELLLEERLRMRPGLPPFDWWYSPPDMQRLDLYLFNITNAERYMNGEDAKLKLVEVGPIVFREVYKSSDVVFNDNGTMTYTTSRDVIFDPSLNTIHLNSTLVFPNIGMLFAASYFWDTNYFMKKILNYVFTKTNVQPLVHKTIYEILYNNTDHFLRVAHSLLPQIAVMNNVAIIPLLNPGRSSKVTVLVGTQNGHQKFFTVDKFNGSNFVPNNDGICKESIQGVSEGLLYPQRLDRTELRYFYDSVCRFLPLHYQDEVYQQGLNGYRFVVPKDAYNRTQPPENDCYKGEPPMLNGLTDMSRCWYSMPVAASNPHFLYGDSKLLTYVDGMKPNASKHSSFTIIEPATGIALASRAAIQSNIYIRPLKGFHQILDKFDDMMLPFLYFEKYSTELPTYIMIVLQLVVALPIIGGCMTACLFALAAYCMWRSAKIVQVSEVFRRKNTLEWGMVHALELESFLDKRSNVDRNNRR